MDISELSVFKRIVLLTCYLILQETSQFVTILLGIPFEKVMPDLNCCTRYTDIAGGHFDFVFVST